MIINKLTLKLIKHNNTYCKVLVERLDSPSSLVVRPRQNRRELIAVTDVCADAISKCGIVVVVREPILAYRYRPDWSGLLPSRTAGLGGG